MVDSFSQTFGAHMETDVLSDVESERTAELVDRKYADEEWTWHGKPQA